MACWVTIENSGSYCCLLFEIAGRLVTQHVPESPPKCLILNSFSRLVGGCAVAMLDSGRWFLGGGDGIRTVSGSLRYSSGLVLDFWGQGITHHEIIASECQRDRVGTLQPNLPKEAKKVTPPRLFCQHRRMSTRRRCDWDHYQGCLGMPRCTCVRDFRCRSSFFFG